MRILLLVAIAALSLPGGAAAVEFGRATPEPMLPQIVVADAASATDRFAAEELARYLRQIAGGALAVVSETGANGARPQIHVGATLASRALRKRAASLAADGFVLRDSGSRFFILGQNARGTLYGVYALLEDRLGCRWVEPGPEGEVVPRRDQVSLKGIDEAQQPSLPHRTLRIRWLGDPVHPKTEMDYIDWQAKQRMNYLYWIGGDQADSIQGRETALQPFLENQGALLDFVRKRGFIIDHSGHSFHRFGGDKPVSFKARESEDRIVEEIGRYLDRHPFLDFLGLWPSDGWGGHAVKDYPLDNPKRVITKAVDFRADEPQPSGTNSYVDFVKRVERRVQERHPKISLTMIAYNRSLLPPDNVKCSGGAQVHIAFRRSYSFGFGDPDSAWNRAQVPLLKDWMKACGHVVLYDYYKTGNLGSLGRPMPRTIAQDLKFLKEVGAKGTASQSNPRYFRTLAANYYVYAKLSWNTGQNVESVLRDYYAHAYGPAAGAAQRLFDAWEADFNRGGDYFRYDWARILPLFRAPVRLRLANMAQDVVRASASDPSALRRAQELKLVIEFFDAFMTFAETRDVAVRAKLDRMMAKYPFLNYAPKSLLNAAELHRAGQ